jgi:hypothetical protein
VTIANFDAVGGYGGDGFPNPFNDLASQAVPQTLRNALYWAEYVYSSMGTYRMAMERIVSYFLTDLEFAEGSDEEQEKYGEFYDEVLNYFTVLQNMLRDRLCFHGDTRAVTREGVFKLRDLAGKTVDVLSEGGVYRPATFRSFGRQELLEVEFSDGRRVLATPDHEWVVGTSTGGTTRVPTTALVGRCIERTVAPRPPQDDDFYEGVRHGFVFGDGSLYNGGKQAVAYFYGDKAPGLMPYFEGRGGTPRPHPERRLTAIYGLPARYKTLPENTASASYWYGFVCGFLAADGSVDTHGCALLTQKAEATLDAIAAQLPRIGMAAGPVRGHRRVSRFERRCGRVDVYDDDMHYVTLLKRFMLAQDFLLPKHRAKFERNYEPTKYGQMIAVKAVRETGLVDEVFCCVEMETHTFVIDNAILTGNCYGNSFASFIVPFQRFLACPRCGSSRVLSEVVNAPQFRFEFTGSLDFVARCPFGECGYKGAWHVDDRVSDDHRKLKIKHWSPHEIELLHDPLTDDVAYLWRIPEDYKSLVKKGHLFHLERVSKEVLKAIKGSGFFRFHPDVLYHMKEPTLAGVRNRGWGLPRVLSNFRQIWYVQVLRRQNEAIALDYVVPLRLITPDSRPGAASSAGQDPLMMMGGGDAAAQLRNMLRKRRRNPAGWQIMPFPVRYQLAGGEANQLVPRDLLDQGYEMLLNDAGSPVELYKGSLQLQSNPVALRLFESTWQHLVHDANAFTRWSTRQTSQILGWEALDARLQRVTMADDPQKQMALLQLYTAGKLSGTTAFRGLGVTWKHEVRQIAEEARTEALIQARVQEELQAAGTAQQLARGQAGQPAGQAAPQGGGQAPPQGGDPAQAAPP